MTHRLQGTLAPARALGAGVVAVDIHLGALPEGVRAGHYLLLHHPDGSTIPFSIASPPHELPALTLHYRPTPGSDDARRMDEILARPGPVTVDLPHGTCGVDADLLRPLVMLAGGTGIAQARSIALEIADQATADVHLYWGARTEADLYARTEFDALAARAARFTWTGAVETPAEGLRSGTVAAVVAEDVAAGTLDLGAVDVLLCGGPPMVWATVAQLRGCGLTEARTRSDVFDYAPRDDLWSD